MMHLHYDIFTGDMEAQISSFQENEAITGREKENLPGFTVVDANLRRAKQPIIERALSYFEEKTEGNRLPVRKDIVPSELKDVLPHICILTPVFDASGKLTDLIVKLMGTHVVEFYGELTGKSVYMHPSRQVSNRIVVSAQSCFEARRPVVAEAFSLSEEKKYLHVSVLYVPLAENGTDIDSFFLLTNVQRNIVDL